MGKHDVGTVTGGSGSSFTPISTNNGGQPKVSSTGRGYSHQDSISSLRQESSCCPAQDRLSNWFGQLGGFGKFLFVLGSILTGSLLYWGTLLVFACSSEDRNS